MAVTSRSTRHTGSPRANASAQASSVARTPSPHNWPSTSKVVFRSFCVWVSRNVANLPGVLKARCSPRRFGRVEAVPRERQTRSVLLTRRFRHPPRRLTGIGKVGHPVRSSYGGIWPTGIRRAPPEWRFENGSPTHGGPFRPTQVSNEISLDATTRRHTLPISDRPSAGPSWLRSGCLLAGR